MTDGDQGALWDVVFGDRANCAEKDRRLLVQRGVGGEHYAAGRRVQLRWPMLQPASRFRQRPTKKRRTQSEHHPLTVVATQHSVATALHVQQSCHTRETEMRRLALMLLALTACGGSSEPEVDYYAEYRGLWVAETIDGEPLPWMPGASGYTVYGASLSLAAGGAAGLWRECRQGFGDGGRMVVDDIRWGASEGEISVRWMGASFGQSGTVNTGTVSGDVLTITRTPLVTATYRFRRVSDDPLASVRLCP